MICGTLAWTIELCMTKYIIDEIFSPSGATLYKNPSVQTVQVKLDAHGNPPGDVVIYPMLTAAQIRNIVQKFLMSAHIRHILYTRNCL